MSMGQELDAPMRPSARPDSSISALTSGRAGMYCAVSARPTMGTSEWIIIQLPSNWVTYPWFFMMLQASSIETLRMRCRTSSGTLGRPSARRSPCHDGV